MIPAIGVVGFGRMAQALLQPLLDQQLLDPAAVRAVVGSEQSACQLSERFHFCVSTDPSSAWQQPLVLLAVKPQQLDAVAASLAGSVAAASLAAPAPAGAGQGALLISVLAGVPLARLERCFPGWCCVRAVPNTPCLVRQGLTGLAFGGGLSPEQKALVHELFARVGEVFELPEAQLDAFLALSSSGPAYAALISEALADGAVAAGLPRALAQHLAQRMLAGSMALLQEQQLHPAQLKDMVASPAGTTMAGLRQLERSGLRTALIEAVLAAAERSRQLA